MVLEYKGSLYFTISLLIFLFCSFFYFSLLNLLQIFEHFLGLYPDLIIMFLNISLFMNLLVVTQSIKNHMWNITINWHWNIGSSSEM